MKYFVVFLKRLDSTMQNGPYTSFLSCRSMCIHADRTDLWSGSRMNTIRTEILLDADHPLYASHFPGSPCTPGSLIIHGLVQLLKQLSETAAFLQTLIQEALHYSLSCYAISIPNTPHFPHTSVIHICRESLLKFKYTMPDNRRIIWL